MRDARAEAIRSYQSMANRLRKQARDALREGWGAWYYEVVGMRVIAERAAMAEVVDRKPQE
jgi:hypothetical protein